MHAPIKPSDSLVTLPAVAPQTRRLTAVLSGGGSIAVAMGIMNVATYGFTMVAARMLGPGSYGAFASLMATLLVVTVLIFLLLLAYEPFKRHDGEVMVLFMLAYAGHRFLNEMLRNDTPPVAFGMTLSQNGSLIVLAAGLLLGLYLWTRPAQYRPAAA